MSLKTNGYGATVAGPVGVVAAESSVAPAPGKPVERADSRKGRTQPVGFAGRRVHLVGIGGCGMYGAARILLQSGAIISGSDMRALAGGEELTRLGARVHSGHAAAHVPSDTQLLVCSSAVPAENPEIIEARRRSIPIIRYAELLGQIMATRSGVSIAGTHGKSTTTGLTSFLFKSAGLDPSFIVGASCDQLGGSSGVGGGPHFIVESCEYARAFLNLRPKSAAILNIEADHLDCYKDLDDIVASFNAFARRVSSDGLLVVNHDDRVARRAVKDVACPVEYCGFGPGADWRAVNLRALRGRFSFRIMYRRRFFAQATLQLAGRYNVANALAAVALAHHAGASAEAIVEALAEFRGVDRRMTHRGTSRGVTIVDDYAHHPTEIRVTLEAIRRRYNPKRTWVVFQPHQASRTRQLFDDFSTAFEHADVVLLPDIYSVRDTEADQAAVGSSVLAERIAQSGKQSMYLPSMREVTDYLAANTTEGDLVVVMGAGDVWKVADELIERMC